MTPGRWARALRTGLAHAARQTVQDRVPGPCRLLLAAQPHQLPGPALGQRAGYEYVFDLIPIGEWQS